MPALHLLQRMDFVIALNEILYKIMDAILYDSLQVEQLIIVSFLDVPYLLVYKKTTICFIQYEPCGNCRQNICGLPKHQLIFPTSQQDQYLIMPNFLHMHTVLEHIAKVFSAGPPLSFGD
jgi:hypothetical protein